MALIIGYSYNLSMESELNKTRILSINDGNWEEYLSLIPKKKISINGSKSTRSYR